jgi:hypothetical protein
MTTSHKLGVTVLPPRFTIWHLYRQFLCALGSGLRRLGDWLNAWGRFTSPAQAQQASV